MRFFEGSQCRVQICTHMTIFDTRKLALLQERRQRLLVLGRHFVGAERDDLSEVAVDLRRQFW